MRRTLAPLLPLWLLAGCLGAVTEPPTIRYHNPLDILDAGSAAARDGGEADGGDGGLPPGSNVSVGSVDGRSLALSSAIYQVEGGGDAGPARTLIYLSDAPSFCQQLQLSDGGLASPWDVLRFHLAGDVSGSYPIASVLPPSGAISNFDWEDLDAGTFGFETGQSGQITLTSVDAQGLQPTTGSYSVDFADAGSVTGRFTASPCPFVPPTAGE